MQSPRNSQGCRIKNPLFSYNLKRVKKERNHIFLILILLSQMQAFFRLRINIWPAV